MSYSVKDLDTENPRWCRGCGDFGILSALKKHMVDRDLAPWETVHVSGIGCSGRTPNYINSYGMHTLHGRAITIATGLILTRPDLEIFVHSGDGDALSIGGNHLLHGINKNLNCTFVLFNNELYALTKSQTSPTTRQGHATNTQPQGTYLEPLNPIRLVLGMGASFVANTADWLSDHMANTLEAAAEHPGFSFVHIFQRCPHYDPNAFNHKRSEWQEFLVNESHGVPIAKRMVGKSATREHDPFDLQAAFKMAEQFKTHFGIVYRQPSKACYDRILQQQTAESPRKERASILEPYVQ
ncbi:MAG: 2-oxoglutarate ferredoxin oxidoreductase subunit beta [Rhodothermales bacterium]|jgi:2-oxoglutarate ferredoxin oxidoreductase subunit beta